MEINPYLSFNGNCEEALSYYTQVLGAKTTFLMRNKEAPEMPGPPETADKILHASFEIDGTRLMAADAPPQWYTKPGGITISIGLKDATRADEIFTALAAGGEVKMPLQKTFWASAFGMVIDRFNIPWMINCE
jgi:PhnB protein